MKYKLIKKYPNSPDTIGLEIHLNGTYWQSHFCTENVEHFHKSSNDFNPENFPEFWEKILDFESFRILSFRSNSNINGGVIFKDTFVDYSEGDTYINSIRGIRATGASLIENTQWDIHSIKRLSDGVIFTVGDEVGRTITWKNCIIKSFKIKDDDLILEILQNSSTGTYSFDEGHDWFHIHKEPLFITEDHVKVFQDDTYWCVNTAPHLWSVFEQTAKARTQLNKGVLAFSTEELAEEYRLFNKPCLLSINDIATVYSTANGKNKNRTSGYNRYADGLIKLTKEKENSQ